MRGSIVALALLLNLSSMAQSSPTSWQTGIRRVELSAESSGEAFEVRISPGIATVFVFADAELLRETEGGLAMELERRESFARVEGAETMLQLVPSDALRAGDALRLSVRFKSGALPARASFSLVVHPVQAERLVEVYRNARTLESYHQELLGTRDEVQRCHEQLAQLRALHGGPGGLAGLLAPGLVDTRGVVGRNLSKAAIQSRADSWDVRQIHIYRAAHRLAVQLRIQPGGPDNPAPWMPEGATLTNRRGEQLRVLSVSQNAPSEAAGENWVVIVEAEAPVEWTPETWTVRFWEGATGRTATFGNITFE